MTDDIYDYVIVGAGMIGSSTAKYVAKLCSEKNSNHKVALIGVIREDEIAEDNLQGAWHDEARITRLIDKSDCWRNLAEQSLLRYEDIEKESDIKFYKEVGFLTLIDEKYKDLEQLEKAVEVLVTSGYKCDKITNCNSRETFPFLNLTENLHGYFQPDKSGYINPRKLIEAQLKIAEANGCHLIKSGVSVITQDNDTKLYKLETMSGSSVLSKNVILCAGAYYNISKLLSAFTEKQLDLTLTCQTVAYAKLSEDEAQRLAQMPSMVTTYQKGRLDGTYILPPVQYPDGHFYLKLGHHDKFEKVLETKQEVEEWYKDGTGDPEAVSELSSFIRDFVTDLKIESVSGGCCVTSKTKDKAGPYVDLVQAGLYIGGGGCGYAAKSCDEIGRLTANLAVNNLWDTTIDRKLMQLQWK